MPAAPDPRPRRPVATARAKPKPKARRRRRPIPWARLPWAGLLWAAAAANVGAGLAYSPVTAATKVRVVGAAPDDHERIARALQRLRGVPALRQDPAAVEGVVQAREDVDRARFRQNLFGRGLLTIDARTPAARLEGARDVWIDASGVAYAGPPPPGAENLPTVRLPAAARRPGLALAGSWNSAAIADLCLGLASEIGGRPWVVERDARGVISLSVGADARIVLGTGESLREKRSQLRRILEGQPGILTQIRELNLAAPDNPAVVPLTETP